MNKFLTILILSMASLHAYGQYWNDNDEVGKLEPFKDIQYNVETQGSFSHGKTPLWLNANKYGLSSLGETNGYVRGSIIRPLQADSIRNWGIGYGVDVAVPTSLHRRSMEIWSVVYRKQGISDGTQKQSTK